jgi:four helix bundle protein
MAMACAIAMAIRSHEDLVAWQLCAAVERDVFALTATPPASRDFELCHQVRKSSTSARANITEGYARCRTRDAARFYEIAFASATETHDHLRVAADRGYVHGKEASRLNNLSAAAARVTKKLMLAEKRGAGSRPPREEPEAIT